MVTVTASAKRDLRNCSDYLKNIKKNRQAAKNLMDDFLDSKEMLSFIAGSLQEPDSEILKTRHLKRMNFIRHDYFMLFRIDGDRVTIMHIFHGLEDFENKLK